MENYQYRPIKAPDQLRVLKVFPGDADEPIRTRLWHRPLSYLPNCEALSYEWGSPNRDHDIICEGKVLKVTANLLAALKRLRPTKPAFKGKKGRLPSETRLLWIDALCVNQEDTLERSEQVKLMADIYRHSKRTLVWIGEEPSLAQEAFQCIATLARFITRRELGPYEQPDLAFLEGDLNYRLKQLIEDPVWPSLVDIFVGRTYFSRLWTLQEISLSSSCILDEPLVCCGGHTLPWTEYRDAARLLETSSVLRLSLEWHHVQNLSAIAFQGHIQRRIQERHDNRRIRVQKKETLLKLAECIDAARYRICNDRRDRIFALLSMTDESTRSRLQRVDYSSSLGEIFQAATECLIEDVKSLRYLDLFETQVTDCTLEPGIPSWVLWIDNAPLRKTSRPFSKSGSHGIKSVPIELCGSVLEVSGFVFDVVTHAYDNLSGENCKSQFLQVYHQLTQSSSAPKSPDFAVNVLWQLSQYQSGTSDTKEDNNPSEAIALELMRIGFADDPLEHHLGLSNLVRKPHSVLTRFAAVISADLDVEPAANENDKLATSENKVSEVYGDAFDKIIECIYEGFAFSHTQSQCRNLFVSERGYWGIGPPGDKIPENIYPPVQEGDYITILSTASAPVILRAINEEYFSLVGLAQVPNLTDDPEFKKGITEDFRKFRIR